MNQQQKDFNLCADFGLADKVRDLAISRNWDADTLGKVTSAFYSFVQSGKMTLYPAAFGLFTEVYNTTLSREENIHCMQVAADTLYNLLGEVKRESEKHHG